MPISLDSPESAVPATSKAVELLRSLPRTEMSETTEAQPLTYFMKLECVPTKISEQL